MARSAWGKAGLCLLPVLSVSTALAASVRGQLVCGAGKAPARGIAVTIKSATTRSAPSFSGANGMFYVNGISSGAYILEVWLSRSSPNPTLTYPLPVSEPVTDVPRLQLEVCKAN